LLQLRLRLCIVAHQGAAGHRGVDTTFGWLVTYFIWENMRRSVETFVRCCLHCVRVRGGGRVPRPYAHTFQPTHPNHIVPLTRVSVSC
jgi:hypothetical protein